MAGTSQQSWQRWQDWAALVIGVLVALSPIVTATSVAAAWTMVVLGVVLAATSLWSLAQPGSVASEWVHGVIGVLLFLAPWVMGYYDTLTGAAWTSWVGGVLTVIVAASALPAATEAHRGVIAH
ncbi:SPW repeat protein [Pseudonocardia nematodicida]|uniref:SPW repeat protein n=1 Tax=Pseudonocardia nematodicida TaxID=1206997 RepID=A0ABV1KF83_9PSEU